MFISPAYAQAATGTSGLADAFASIGWILLVIPIMYFLVLRPEQQRRKAHMQMVDNVRRGDVVVTAGGIVGKVVKVLEGSEIMVEIADDVRVKVVKQTLLDVRTKTDAGGEVAAKSDEKK